MNRAKRTLATIDPVDEDGNVRAVIETTQGSRTKLTYDPDLGAFIAKKSLPEGMHFPFDFGFIPSTLAGDGDPLDVLVLLDESVPTGTIVPVRLIGVIEARQTEKDGEVVENDRLIAIGASSVRFADVKKLSSLPAPIMEQIEHFFVTYNAEAGKRFEPLGRHGARRAANRLAEGRARFARTPNER